jgi:thioredoxin-like negative regulator of GroEL
MWNSRTCLLGMSLSVLLASLSQSPGVGPASAESPKEILDQGRAMVKDAEEMIMHGGMGDGRAILHHCAEVAKQAQAIIKALPARDEHGKEAVPYLQDAIKHCARVAEMGDKVDPGASLNPAAKARAAAKEAMKHLLAMKDGGT